MAEKSYLIKNYTGGEKEPVLIFIHDAKALLAYIALHKSELISVYECECVLDWS